MPLLNIHFGGDARVTERRQGVLKESLQEDIKADTQHGYPGATGAWFMYQLPDRGGLLLRKECQEQITPKVRVAGLIHSKPGYLLMTFSFCNYKLNNQNQDILYHLYKGHRSIASEGLNFWKIGIKYDYFLPLGSNSVLFPGAPRSHSKLIFFIVNASWT